jgi:hypothetical protein
MSVGVSLLNRLARRTTIVVLAGLCAACMPCAGCTRQGASTKETEHQEHHEHGDHDGDGHDHASHKHSDDEHHEEEAALTEADIDMPRDYASALARLQSYRQQILEALAEGHAHEAHRPLDEMDLVIGKLMLIARDSGVPRRDWEEVNLARRALRAQFDQAHAQLDQEQPVDRAKLAETTAATLKRLEAMGTRLPKTADAPRTEQPASAARESQP